MDPATLTLLVQVGFAAADCALEFYDISQTENAAKAQQALSHLVSTTASDLRNAIDSAAGRVIDKLEADKMEELCARINNLSMLLSMGRKTELLQYAMTLNESVQYAQNRISERKIQWIGPWLAGQAVFFAALNSSAGDSEQARKDLERASTRAKHLVLDTIAPEIVRAGATIPWETVVAFLRPGGSHHLSAIASLSGTTMRPDHEHRGVPGGPTYLPGGVAEHCPFCRQGLRGNVVIIDGRYACAHCRFKMVEASPQHRS